MIIIVETVRFFLFAFFILSRTNVRASNLLLQRNAKYLLLKRKQKKSVEVQYGALDDVSKKQPEEAEKELSLGATTEPKGSVQKMFSIFEDRAEGRHGALSDDEGRDEDGEESEIEPEDGDGDEEDEDGEESEIEPEDVDGDEEDEDGSDDEGSELGKDDNEGNDGRRTEEVRNGSSYRETSPNKAYNIIRGRVEKRHESSGADDGDEENEGDENENESDLDNDEENESDDDDDGDENENESDDDDNDGIEDVQRSIHNESNRSFYIEKSDDDDDYIEANEDDEMEEYELMYEMESWVE